MKRKKIVIFIIVIIIIGINEISLSKNDYESKERFECEIAKAVINVDKDEKIDTIITKDKFPLEYNFCINNYKENDINEVDFEYQIEIEISNNDFPVNILLFDCKNNEQLELNQGKSKLLKLDKNKKVSRKFRIYLEWKNIDRKLSDDLKVNLKINAIQSEV